MKTIFALFRVLPSLMAGAHLTGVSASEPEPTVTLEAVVVRNRSSDLTGIAGAASDGSVGHLELESRPFLRRGELLEVVPGVVITQHSGGGKANQYFLRGFNLDHGTDFAIGVDGMPVNLRSHGHGQGYADLNFIIPEFVQRVDYGKGPYSVHVGDFSSAGSAEFHLVDRLPSDFGRLELGENGFRRMVAGGTVLSSETLATTVGFEAMHDDGPWEIKDNLRRYSGLARMVWSGAQGSRTALTAMLYQSEWRATDQVPQRAIDSGLIQRFGTLDTSNGGETERASLSFDWSRPDADASTRFSAYVIHYRLNLFSNFTGFLNDPESGDQFNQRDRRAVLGGSVERTWTTTVGSRDLSTAVGLQVRDDLIGQVALSQTAQRVLVANVRDDDVHESSAGLFAKTSMQWNSRVRLDAGLRGDFYRFDVESDNSENSGIRMAGIASPKVGVVLGPWNRTEVYFNAGFGFHSNDARGTTIRVSPVTGEAADRVDPLVRSRGAEVGLRSSVLPGWVTTLAFWQLDLDSELVFVGDAGETEPSGATRRYGFEWANYYRASDWLALDVDLSLTNARYRSAGVEDRIVNSISTVATAGVVVGRSTGWFGAMRLRYFGDQPLIEDNSVVQPSSLSFNGRIGWRTRDWEVSLDVLNVLNRPNADIAYYYASRLAGEPASGVEDVHLHPAEPRTYRLGMTFRF